MTGPLEGLKVLDVSEGIAAPFCAKLLGDLGADVVKVERPGAGDWTRTLGPFPEGVADRERSASFFYFNTSKRSVTLDLHSPEGRDDLRRLSGTYDIVISSHTEGQLGAMGLGYEQLRAWNSRLILVNVTGFGSRGPRADYASSHLIACAAGGWARTCGLADREPLQAGGAIAETLTGAYAAAATLTATLGRAVHGNGEHIDVSAQQAVLCGALFPSLRYEYAGDLGVRNSQYGPGPSFILPAQDGYIGVNVLTADQWQMLCEFLGRPDLLDNPRYAGRERMRLADEIAAAFRDAVRERTVDDLFHGGQAWRVPFGLVPNMEQIVGLEPHRERGFITALEHPRAGTVAVPGVPFKSTATEPAPYRPPLLGEHTDEVFAALETERRPEAQQPEPAATLPLPLRGLRVVDLSMFFSGPLVTQILGDAGADIIKVESVQRIDGWRGAVATGVDRPWERSPNFNWVNRSKRGITLNLADPRGAEIVKRLVAGADVLIENYTPRVMANFGLEYETLREINPALVMMSMPGFGTDVSWRDYVAFGMSTEQMAGFSHLTGYPGGPPLFTGTNGGDPFVGTIGATALLAALWHRQQTGQGQHIDLSQVEACTLFVGDAITGWSLAGHDPGRTGNVHPRRCPHGIYPCDNDSWIAIDCQSDDQWRTFADLLGRPDWASPGSPLASVEGRLAARAEIDAAITDWTRARQHVRLMDELQALGIPAGAVMSGPDLLDDPHLAETGAFLLQDRDGIGLKHYPAQPYRLRNAESAPNRRAPYLGEHSAEVLREYLRMTDEELAELERDDVIGTVPIAARVASAAL